MRSRFVRPVRRRELPTMRVGVIDVGANTMRLLVAARAGSGLTTVHRERIQLGLGEFIEQGGAIPRDRLQATGRAARDQAASARRLGCSRIEIVVTSPGRQAENADELIASLERVRGASARVLTAEEEASFAYRAVVAAVDDSGASVAGCDVAGGWWVSKWQVPIHGSSGWPSSSATRRITSRVQFFRSAMRSPCIIDP